jgi:hypothetical protein
MRIAFAVPLILVCGLASAAVAQTSASQTSAQSADNHVQTVSTAASQAAPTEPKAQTDNPEAAAALAMAIRQQEAQDRRIAQYACASGDTSKCPAGDAPRSAGSPSS